MLRSFNKKIFGQMSPSKGHFNFWLAIFIICKVCDAFPQEVSNSQKLQIKPDNADKRFDSNPLVGLTIETEADKNDELELPSLNRVKKVTDSRKKRYHPYKSSPRTGKQADYRFGSGAPTNVNQQQPSANKPIQEITEFALFRENVENKILRHKRNVHNDKHISGRQYKLLRYKRNDDENENVSSDNYNSGLQYSAYGEAGTGRSAGPARKPQQNKKSGPRPTQRPELAPQIDEDFVSQLFKHPEAVKYVYDYLEEKKSQTSTTKAPRTTKKPTTAKPTTTKAPSKAISTTKVPALKSIFSVTPPRKPLSASQANINRLNSLFGLALLSNNDLNGKKNENNNNRNGGESNPSTNQNKKIDKIPSLASIFGAIDRPPQKPDNVQNPLLNGEQKPDFQFFGPTDFVPKSQYSLPIHTNGPMRLKYISAADFPYNTKFGIVPIPR